MSVRRQHVRSVPKADISCDCILAYPGLAARAWCSRARGPDAKLQDLRHRLAKCPRTLLNRRRVSESDPCGVEFAKPLGT
jgi:hypothetical protein